MSRCAPMARPLAIRLGTPSMAAASPLARRALATIPTHRSDGTTTTTTTSDGATPPPPPPPSASADSPNPWTRFAASSASDKELPPVKDSIFERLSETAIRPWAESRLLRQGTPPVGSRRRRVALRQHPNLPFEQLPFQCFQEARKILGAHREKLLAALRKQLARAKYLRDAPLAAVGNSERVRRMRIFDAEKRATTLKIWADINDPAVRRKFEDGQGDMTMPVYRHLAQRRWEKYHKLLINQRIKQFHIVPDFLPGLTTKADVQLYYRQKPVQPGTILPSLVTEHPPTLRVQTFEPGTRLATIVVVDGDVPDVDNDTFFHRLHFIAANVPIDPTNKNLALSRLHKKHIVVPWLPAHAQMGSPYHRYGIFLMWQLDTTQRVSVRSIRQRFYGGSKQQRDRFNLTDFNTRCHLSPFGFTMFRTQWDDHTKAVMERHGLPGADVVLKPMRIASLKPPAKARGWEARRQGPKYRFLWKYTKRIRGLSTGKRWKGSRG